MTKITLRIFFFSFLLSLPLFSACKSSGATRPDAVAGQRIEPPSVAYGFTLKDDKGKPVSLSDYRGKVVWLSFWATWCHACKTEMQHMNELRAKIGEEHFEVLGINTDAAEARALAISQARYLKLDFPMLFDPEGKAIGQYNPSMELPYGVLIDTEGKMHYIQRGFIAGTEKEIEAEIEKLLPHEAK